MNPLFYNNQISYMKIFTIQLTITLCVIYFDNCHFFPPLLSSEVLWWRWWMEVFLLAGLSGCFSESLSLGTWQYLKIENIWAKQRWNLSKFSSSQINSISVTFIDALAVQKPIYNFVKAAWAINMCFIISVEEELDVGRWKLYPLTRTSTRWILKLF